MRISSEVLAHTYQAGATVAELAFAASVSPETVRRELVRLGVPRRPRGSPAGKYRPKHGVAHERDGTVLVRDPQHSRARSNGYVAQHILVAERMLKRPLRGGEVVWHRDGDRSNNHAENLLVFRDSSELTHHLLAGNARARGDSGNPKRQVRRRRGPEEILAELRQLQSTLVRPIRRSDLVPPWPSYRAVARAFGRWQIGVELATAKDPTKSVHGG
jgi:hypothetical protein